MLGLNGESPSRFELLSIVKKHSMLLQQTTADEQEVSDIEKDNIFWHDVMELYFVLGKEARRRLDDDLIFFVRKTSLDGFEFIDNAEDDSPYFVRRWAPKLNNLVERNTISVDWRCSFYLNLIAHTSFSVTVLICSHRDLQNYQRGETTSISPIYKVVKTVYASPDRINFHLDSRKEVETTTAYPDICFTFDDFDSTFDSMVLTDADHCFCVLLNAHGGAAFPNKKASQDCCSSDKSSLHYITDAGKVKNNKLTLFSGFVSYQTVRETYDVGKSGFGSLLSLHHSSGKTHKLYMKGPGGRGEIEVAVSGVLDESMQGLSPHSSGKSSKKEFRFGETVRKAATVASATAKHVYAAGARQTSDKMLPLRCCLMSISLPWESIAYDLLFKGNSPANLEYGSWKGDLPAAL